MSEDRFAAFRAMAQKVVASANDAESMRRKIKRDNEAGNCGYSSTVFGMSSQQADRLWMKQVIEAKNGPVGFNNQ